MTIKIVALLAAFAYANAGFVGAPIAYSAPASYALPASYAAPLSYSAPLPYSAPISYSAPLSYSTPTVTSQAANIYRSFGNLGQVSAYSKTVDTPFSSVSKSDVRVSNPGVRIAHAPLLGVAYSAAPTVSHINYVSGYANYAF